MKFYDPNGSRGTHTIKVSLQDDQYKGDFTYKIGGNCKGADILAFDIADNCAKAIENFEKHNCKIRLDEDAECLFVTLTDPETGDTCDCELDDNEFMWMVVGMEIVDFEEE